jgi:hypothetical protein
MGMFFHLYSVLFSIRPPSMCHHSVRKTSTALSPSPFSPKWIPGIRFPKRQRCIPSSRLQKSCAKICIYVLYKKSNSLTGASESVVANVSIGELLCEQRPAEKDSKGWEITSRKVNNHFISSAARTKRDLQHGSVSHVLDLLAPVRLGCFLCKW